MTTMITNTNHEIVSKGSAMRRDRLLEGLCGGGRGTLVSLMDLSFVSLSLMSVSTGGTTIRALWVIALALVAIGAIDRMKPATPKRPAMVRVDNKPTPLYKEPDRRLKLIAIAQLSKWALLLGALAAILIGFLLAIALELVGGLLRS